MVLVQSLLLIFIASVSSTKLLGIIAANLQTMNEFNLCWIDPAQGGLTYISNLTRVGGIFPGGSAFDPSSKSLGFLSIGSSVAAQEALFVVNAYGKVVSQQRGGAIVYTNLAYDANLGSFFISGYNPTTTHNDVYSWTPQAGRKRLGVVPGVVQVGESTYCPNGHIFFLTIQNYSVNSSNTLSRFDTKAGKYLDNVVLDDTVEILIWDYKSAVMYAWVADSNYAGVLVSIDITTGKRITTLLQFANLSANGGTAVMDFDSKVIYASLLNIQNNAMTPVWVVVDVATGKFQTFPTTEGFPINIALYSS